MASSTPSAFLAAPSAVPPPRRPRYTTRATRAAKAARLEALQDEVFALTDQVEKLTTALSAAGDIVLRHPDGANAPPLPIGPAFEATFDRPPDEILALLATSSAEAKGPDQPLPTKAGARWFTHASIVLPGPDGEAVRHTVLTDVTERKAIEAALAEARDSAQAASRAKSRFLALASHELRTPLNGILGMAGLLMDTPLTPEQESYARAIRVSGEALLSIVGDVLDHARIEAGRLELTPAPTDVGALIQDVVELLAPRAHAKAIELTADLGPGLPARIQVDGPRLRQVLFNLAGNAVKFTQTGGVTVRARVAVRADKTVLVLAVEDTGIGLTAADAARVFNEFEQADQGAARRADGTGLGLSIALAIVRAMGADIAVDSALGRGSTFSLELPFEADDVRSADEPPSRLAGRRVLVIADRPIEPPILCRRLAEAGAEVGRAPDFAAARVHGAAAARAGRPFDTLVVDYAAVSQEDSLAAFAALRATFPAATRAVVLLAPAERSSLDGLRSRGFDGYLTRPVRKASLIDVVARLAGAERGFAPDPRDPGVPIEPGPPPVAATPLDVLVVDDNPINALLARALLVRLGHRVEVASDGMAALVAVRRGPTTIDPAPAPAAIEPAASLRRFAAVLTDLHMPGRDGFDVIKAIRADEARHGLRPARLIAVTADARPDVAAAVADAGGDATLTKPFDPARLAALLAEA